MKILLKNKLDKRLETLNLRYYRLLSLKTNIEPSSVYTILIGLNILGALGIYEWIVNDDIFTFILATIFISSFSFVFTKFFKKIKKHNKISKKILCDIKCDIKKINKLKNKDNYKLFYEEMMILIEKDRINEVSDHLVQSVIEEYRRNSEGSIQRLSNKQRLDYFSENELNVNNDIQITIENQ